MTQTRTQDREQRTRSQLQPVLEMFNNLAGLSFEDLTREKEWLEELRRGRGLLPDQWYRLQAIRAVLTSYQVTRQSSRLERLRARPRHTLRVA